MDNKSLEAKIAALQADLQQYSVEAQEEINALEQAIRNKIRAAQQRVDQSQGKIDGYKELLDEQLKAEKFDKTSEEIKNEKS